MDGEAKAINRRLDGHDIEIRDLKKQLNDSQNWILALEKQRNKDVKELWIGIGNMRAFISDGFNDVNLLIQGLRNDLNTCIDLDKQKEAFEDEKRKLKIELENKYEKEYQNKLKEIDESKDEKRDDKHRNLDRRWVKIGIIVTIMLGVIGYILAIRGF